MLVTQTNDGCVNTYDELQFITVNNYEAEIALAPYHMFQVQKLSHKPLVQQ